MSKVIESLDGLVPFQKRKAVSHIESKKGTDDGLPLDCSVNNITAKENIKA